MKNALINRLILWLSLAGMVLTLHLWIQKARGFDQGCLGLDSHVAAVEAGCNDAGLQAGSHLFGVSNAAWGYAFYFALALISFGKIVVPPGWARRLHLIGEVAVVVGFLYSGYLLYFQALVAEAFCVLCLVSIGLVTALLASHVAVRLRGGFLPIPATERAVELGLAGGALFAMMGVLIGVLVFVNRLGTRPLDQGSTGRELERIVGQALQIYIDGGKLAEMRACHFDWDAQKLPAGRFTGPATPFIGNPSGPQVVIFYDPNCAHCRAYHPVFLRVVEKYKDRARFTIVPRLLWEESMPQVAALRLAEGSGKYFELWQRMFDLRIAPRHGAGTAQIEALFRDLGIDAADLERRLAAERPAVLSLRRQENAAGITGVPVIYIGGRKVWAMNRGEACMGTLIERVLSGVVKPVAAESTVDR